MVTAAVAAARVSAPAAWPGARGGWRRSTGAGAACGWWARDEPWRAGVRAPSGSGGPVIRPYCGCDGPVRNGPAPRRGPHAPALRLIVPPLSPPLLAILGGQAGAGPAPTGLPPPAPPALPVHPTWPRTAAHAPSRRPWVNTPINLV